MANVQITYRSRQHERVTGGLVVLEYEAMRWIHETDPPSASRVSAAK